MAGERKDDSAQALSGYEAGMEPGKDWRGDGIGGLFGGRSADEAGDSTPQPGGVAGHTTRRDSTAPDSTAPDRIAPDGSLSSGSKPVPAGDVAEDTPEPGGRPGHSKAGEQENAAPDHSVPVPDPSLADTAPDLFEVGSVSRPRRRAGRSPSSRRLSLAAGRRAHGRSGRDPVPGLSSTVSGPPGTAGDRLGPVASPGGTDRGRHGSVTGPAEITGAPPAASFASAGALPVSLLVPRRRRTPPRGWRGALYRASGGLIRIPASAAEGRRQDLISRARSPVAAGHYRIAVLSLKGGVGKTTVTMGLGSTLAAMRGDRIIAVDASPDRGTLAEKLMPQTTATVRDLLAARDRIHRYADVRSFTSQAPSRLEVLASAQDPAASVAYSEKDYRDTCAILERFYSICLTDCGTGLLYSAMAGVLQLADQIVLVTTSSVDGARSADACLDWLTAHGHHDLAANAVVAVTGTRRHRRTGIDTSVLTRHFSGRCRAVVLVPYDPYLAHGAEADLDQLGRSTAGAFLRLAAMVGDGFGARRPEHPVLPALIAAEPAASDDPGRPRAGSS